MTSAILLVLGGLAGLALGGELLVRGAVGIAQRLRVSTLFTGLVIVGAATSMPEMVASVQAALAGSAGIAWGNIVGSNIANSLLILGVTALVAPIAISGMGRRDAVVALGASLSLWALALGGLGARGIGLGALGLLGIYIWWRYAHPSGGLAEDEPLGSPPGWLTALGFFAAGLVSLIAGGQALVDGAIDLALLAGVSETAIGLTVVAIGTSLPELAASLAAALRGRAGLALGNVVGSNIYNILLIGGVTMAIAPQPVPESLGGAQAGLMSASAMMLLVLLWRGGTIGRLAGGVMAAIFAANIVWVFV
ncbi:MAG: sodium:proton exchanger [Erythrobacter sp. SCN 62-14]|nr:MAG: sodium:proton exchanger [Erythrobacter sp. SCN 62-14]